MYHARPQQGAYGAMDAALASPKRAEAQVIAGLTRRLIAAYADDAVPFSRRAALLHDNLRLWHTIAAAAAEDVNAFPDALRAGLLSLAGFVERTTRDVLAGRGDVRALLDVNRHVVAGLTAGPT